MTLRDRRLQELRASVPEIDVDDAFGMQARGAVLIDVREAHEIAGGSPPGALRLGRGYLELHIEQTVPDVDTPVLLMCGGGVRSLFAAEGLQRLGYRDVRSVRGGISAWRTAGLPIEVPHALDARARERYDRHLRIPEIGAEGQQRLLASKVVLLGAGGLGSPVAWYLAAAGVGTLTLIDDDVVDRSNLQRQTLHTDAAVGTPKVESARARLRAFNPDVTLDARRLRLTADNVEDVLTGHDVVVDGTDNFATRYLVNDACVKLGLPNVHGAVHRFEGQVSVFWPRSPKRRGPCYRCLFPSAPPPELAPSCADAGVLGVLPGVIGCLQAVETIKLLLDLGDPLVGRMLLYDALHASFVEVGQRRDPQCRWCADGAPFPGYDEGIEACRGG